MYQGGYWQSILYELRREAGARLRFMIEPERSHHVIAYLLEARSVDQRLELIRKVDSETVWVLARTTSGELPSFSERLATDVLGARLLGRALDSTDFLRTVHLSTPFRLGSKHTFSRRGIQLELLELRRSGTTTK